MKIKNNFGDDSHKCRAEKWFQKLRDDVCSELESIESTLNSTNNVKESISGRFVRKHWKRAVGPDGEGGGGVMSILRGRVFEKAGVNVSTVFGKFSKEFQASIPGAEHNPNFWASGISVVIHPLSPLVPAVHMNTRMIVTTQGWFGGGTDLTPAILDKEGASLFHEAIKATCDKHDPNYYPKFKEWCDEYFFLPHRNEARGVGGVFFDNLNNQDWEKDFKFVQDIGKVFLDIYPVIVKRAAELPWNKKQKEIQLEKRGRYVEFNLLYDRGTLFGLKTGGNVEAILMSMPPTVSWV